MPTLIYLKRVNKHTHMRVWMIGIFRKVHRFLLLTYVILGTCGSQERGGGEKRGVVNRSIEIEIEIERKHQWKERDGRWEGEKWRAGNVEREKKKED